MEPRLDGGSLFLGEVAEGGNEAGRDGAGAAGAYGAGVDFDHGDDFSGGAGGE